jgi:hypothetical protein
VQIGSLDQVDQVRQREHVRDHLQHLRVTARRPERAREERHRQDDQIDDGRRPLGRADERGDAEAEAGEGDPAEEDDWDQGRPALRALCVVEHDAEDHGDHHLQQEHEQRRGQDRREIGRGRQRRRAEPFQDAALAAQHERDRQTAEGRVRTAVADDPDEQPVGRRDAVDRPVVDRAEQQEQHRREDEDEHGRLAVPPEDQLLQPQLVREDGHAPSSGWSRSR